MYGLLLTPEGDETQGFAVASFTSTKIKPLKDWHTAMYMIKGRPHIFTNRARFKTVQLENDAGIYYNIRIEPLNKTWVNSLINPKTHKSLILEAVAFRKNVLSGMAKPAYDTAEETSGNEAQTEAETEDDLPF